MSKGVSLPGVLVLDPKGSLKAKFFEDSYRDRLTANTLLGRLFPALVMPAKKLRNEDFTLAISSSDTEVVMGSQVDLFLDIELPEGSHLYAPGSESYVPLSLEIPENDFFVAGKLELPAATLKRLEAIDETVGVYSGKFRIRQTLKIKGSKAIASLKSPKALTVKAKLGYQVCTETSCLMPSSASLEWNVVLNPLDFQRVPEQIQHK